MKSVRSNIIDGIFNSLQYTLTLQAGERAGQIDNHIIRKAVGWLSVVKSPGTFTRIRVYPRTMDGWSDYHLNIILFNPS